MKKPAQYQIQRKGKALTLTPEQEKIYRELAPVTFDKKMAEIFGCSKMTIQRLNQKLGIVKDMAVIKKKHTAEVVRICKKKGIYEAKKGKPLSPATLEGQRKYRASSRYRHPMEILKERDPKRYKRVCKKSSKRMKEMLEDELYVNPITLMKLTDPERYEEFRTTASKRQKERFEENPELKQKFRKANEKYLADEGRVKKVGETLHRMYERERKRVELGMKQLTKLPIIANPYGPEQTSYRNRMIKFGYILGDSNPKFGERYIIYYDEETERHPKAESNAKSHGFTILPLPQEEEPQQQDAIQHVNVYREQSLANIML